MNVLDWVDGYKTYLGAALFAFVGFDSAAHLLNPEMHALLFWLAGAVSLVGVRGVAQKILNHLATLSGQKQEKPNGSGIYPFAGAIAAVASTAALAIGTAGHAASADHRPAPAPRVGVGCSCCPCGPACPCGPDCACGDSCDCPCVPACSCRPKAAAVGDASVTFRLGVNAYGRWRPIHHEPRRPHAGPVFRYRARCR